jgi:hypothetical protein
MDAPRPGRAHRASITLGRFLAALSAFAMLGALSLGASPAAAARQHRRAAPTHLRLHPGRSSITARWAMSATRGVTGFRVRWRRHQRSAGRWSKRAELASSAHAYAISSLPDGTYEVLVQATYGHNGAGRARVAAATVTAPEEAPAAKGGEASGATGGKVLVSKVTVRHGEAEGAAQRGGLWQSSGEEGPPMEGLPGAAVSPTPAGPSTPLGGWSVAYADGFGAPLGSGAGHDNTLFPNNCTALTSCAGFNSNEMEVMNPSAVSEGPEGLKLTCTYTAAAQAPGSKHYVCGSVRGPTEPVAGYAPFKWSPGKGQTLVFQAVAKLPPNTGEADPGWWSDGPPWNDAEIDFFEGGGWGAQHTTGWNTDNIYTAWLAKTQVGAIKYGFKTDPSLAFHTYTFELGANNTYSVWIDGVLQSWATNVGPASPDLFAKDTLTLSYALRTCPQCTTGFTSGTREFDVRSVAVYEDAAHAGVGIENGGVAPGTTLG